MSHELLRAFAQVDLPLCPVLAQMLNDHPKHCTLRRGCGLTQSTRFLAAAINRSRDPAATADLEMFSVLSPSHVDAIAARTLALGWAGGWRGLEQAPPEVREHLTGLPEAPLLLSLASRLDAVAAHVTLPESRLLLGLIRDVLGPGHPDGIGLPVMANKPEIGSCSQAEEFFLEIAHGKVRRGGHVNLWVDDLERVVLVEKMALGESHSAMFLREANLSGVRIPPGSLAALRLRDDPRAVAKHRHGAVHRTSELAAVRFLRLTTLSVAPTDRARAFSSQFQRQLSANMLSPASTTLDDLQGFADAALRGA